MNFLYSFWFTKNGRRVLHVRREMLKFVGKKVLLMLTEKTMERLRILAESAKYDVSCSSSGTVRKGKDGMVGNTVGGMGICHSFADDGRCISLLKVMLTNYCMYD